MILTAVGAAIVSCLGVHFAITEIEANQLRSFPDDRSRLDHLQMEIEECYFRDNPDLLAESDKSWDTMHRVLTDGGLRPDCGRYPLNQVVLGGESLYSRDDYIISLKTLASVRDIATALVAIEEPEFRERYRAIDPGVYRMPLSEEDFAITWESFLDVRDLFVRAARLERYVLFTADQ